MVGVGGRAAPVRGAAPRRRGGGEAHDHRERHPEGGADRPTIAVIGPNADVARLGGYYGIPRTTVSPLEGIRALVGNRAEIVHAQGVQITQNDDWWEDEVVLADPEANRRMIAEAVVAMEFRASAEDIGRMSHAHPTYTEGMKEAALIATDNRALHL